MRERKRIREGLVISDKMDKTVTVEISVLKPHPLLGKVIKSRSRLKAHDEKNECHTGDRVRVIEFKPISKTKRWRVMDIVERSESAEDYDDTAGN